ncbi:hypothetical protein BGZ98_008441 [Dissophora globulifera]|nr:hypothetical protein BGZ98_008441 [Dissophora globulifera]
MILPHYNSPYEALYYNQPDVTHFIGKDLKIGTVCVSVREGQDAMHFLVRTILKFANIDIPHSYRSTPEFEECRSFYHKKDDMLPLLHVALHHCFESIPEPEVNRHQVARHQFSTDHSVFVLDESSWLQNPCYISSVVGRLEEIRQENFTHVLKNLEAQMIETENYLLQATRISMDLPAMIVGDKTEEQRSDALQELVETEISYNKRMQDLVNLQVMECYKQYLMRYKRAQETHSALNKKSAGYRALQENCAQTNSIQTLSNLLIEPTQRIVKYPLLFKAILSGTNRDSADVNGLRDAAELAARIAYMEKAKPEQRAEILFNLRGIIENCPDSLLSQNRSVVAYLDGYETNLLTGERGRPITLILFSDKIMIVRRPRDASGDTLFQLKEDDEARRRREKEDKEKQERQKRVWRDSKREGVVETDTGGMRPPTRSNITAGFQILRKDWKFMGWMDILKLKVSVVEQTDPEGLFCITTRDHQETKDDPWETTRGILPEVLDSRDPFISKLYETLALAKAATAFCGAERTSRLHVAELELFCNVFTETQYRDIQCKGDIALFYSSSTSAPVDIMPFTRLPLFVGMIQATESGLRAILRSKASLNGVGQLVSTSSDPNPPMNMDAFQIHISELALIHIKARNYISANFTWTLIIFSKPRTLFPDQRRCELRAYKRFETPQEAQLSQGAPPPHYSTDIVDRSRH